MNNIRMKNVLTLTLIFSSLNGYPEEKKTELSPSEILQLQFRHQQDGKYNLLLEHADEEIIASATTLIRKCVFNKAITEEDKEALKLILGVSVEDAQKMSSNDVMLRMLSNAFSKPEHSELLKKITIHVRSEKIEEDVAVVNYDLIFQESAPPRPKQAMFIKKNGKWLSQGSTKLIEAIPQLLPMCK